MLTKESNDNIVKNNYTLTMLQVKMKVISCLYLFINNLCNKSNQLNINKSLKDPNDLLQSRNDLPMFNFEHLINLCFIIVF